LSNVQVLVVTCGVAGFMPRSVALIKKGKVRVK